MQDSRAWHMGFGFGVGGGGGGCKGLVYRGSENSVGP